MDLLNDGWTKLLKDEMDKEYYIELMEFLEDEYSRNKVYPARAEIFNAFNLTAYEDVKAVIFGQDPYHGEGQACGLSFSVRKGVDIPPSLMNIYKELEDDLGCKVPDHGNLEKWAREGVLLLNSVLTVREGEAGSHKNKGWEFFTDRVIEILNLKEDPIVFILWGNKAIDKKKLIDNPEHFIIESSHPSPLGAYRSFWGSRPFSRTNNFLESRGRQAIDWCI